MTWIKFICIIIVISVIVFGWMPSYTPITHTYFTVSTVANPSPAREAACMCFYDVTDSLYRLAGYNGDSAAPSNFNHIYRNKPGDTTWTLAPTPPWGNRHSLGCLPTDSLWVNGKVILIFGGNPAAVSQYGDIWQYKNGAWTQLADSIASLMERKVFLYFYLGGKIYWGMGYSEGVFDEDVTTLFYDWYSYDGDTVLLVKDSLPITGRGTLYQSLPVIEGEAYIIGGASPDTNLGGTLQFHHRTDAFSWNPLTDQLTSRGTHAQIGSAYPDIVFWGGYLWSFFGWNGSSNQSYVLRYNWVGWERISVFESQFVGRHAGNVVPVDSSVYIIGGISNSGTISLMQKIVVNKTFE